MIVLQGFFALKQFAQLCLTRLCSAKPHSILAIVCQSLLALTVSAQEPIPVRAVTVKSELVRERAEALGTLRANESVLLTANVTEQVSALHFDDGEQVQRGQVLVEMTSEEEHAMLEEAMSHAEEAKRQLERISKLATKGSASEALLDQNRRAHEAAQARLLATQSRLQDRLISAPFDGVLGLRNISVGALVRPGDVITTLTDNRQMKLDFELPTHLLSHVHTGLPIVATSQAYPDRQFQGRVTGVDNQIDPVTRAFKARALLVNTDGALKQGMLMNLNLYYQERNALVVPESAILPEGKRFFVMQIVGDPASVEKREVTLGTRRPGQVEILSGVQTGDDVVTDGAFKLRPGDPVVVTETTLAKFGVQ